MRIKTALDRRTTASRRLHEVYSRARHFKFTSAEINAESLAVRATCNKCPAWVHAYLEGVESVLRDSLYANDLEYCSYVRGNLVSHYRGSPRYYEDAGLSPREVCHENTNGGHYWKGTDKPYFTNAK